MEQYESGAVLGRGAFGAAVKVTRRRDNAEFVIKKVDITNMPEEEKRETKREVLIMQRLSQLCDHPNIVAYYDSFFDTDTSQLCIVMEYADAGALSDLVKEAKAEGGQLPLPTIVRLFTQLTLAVQAMHAVPPAGILHRDLKTQNVFLKRCAGAEPPVFDVKLGDFGLSKNMKQDEMAKSIVGTPYNLAPELCQGLPYAKPVDVWALGCVLYEMATARHAFEGQSLPALVMKIMRGMCPSVRERRYAASPASAEKLEQLAAAKAELERLKAAKAAAEGAGPPANGNPPTDEELAKDAPPAGLPRARSGTIDWCPDLASVESTEECRRTVKDIDELVQLCLQPEADARCTCERMLAHPLLLQQKREEGRRQSNDREARKLLQDSFAVPDGVDRLGEFAPTEAEKREADMHARTPLEPPDLPLKWGYGQTFPGMPEANWQEDPGRPGSMKVVSMAARYDDSRSRTFQLLITDGGQLQSRGDNCEHGQLGQFSKTNAGTFGPVQGLEGVRVQQAACGTVHALALTEDARVYSWGCDNENLRAAEGAHTCHGDGRLGYVASRLPVQIPKEIEALRPEQRFRVTAPRPLYVRRKDLDAMVGRIAVDDPEVGEAIVPLWQQLADQVEKMKGDAAVDGFLEVRSLRGADRALSQTAPLSVLDQLALRPGEEWSGLIPDALEPPREIGALPGTITMNDHLWVRFELDEQVTEEDVTPCPAERQWSAWVCQPENSPRGMEEILERDNVSCIAAGEKHSAAVTDAGRLFCWGSGQDGQLGTGDEEDRSEPTAVEFVIPKWARADAESLVETRTGRQQVAGWLREHCRDETHTDIAAALDDAPRLLNVYLNCQPFLHQAHVAQVSCGDDFTLAITQEGQVYSWGFDERGQLGHGREDEPQCTPRRIEALQHIIEQYGRVTQVACGAAHVLALTESSAVVAWGESEYGQCGVHMGATSSFAYEGDDASDSSEGGADTIVWEPQLIKELLPSPHPRGLDERLEKLPGRMRAERAVGDRVVQVAAGTAHSLALIEAGHVLSWGRAHGPGGSGVQNGPLGTCLSAAETKAGCRPTPKLVTRHDQSPLFDMYERYKVVVSGVVLHAEASFSSRELGSREHGEELEVDDVKEEGGIKWVHHAHSVGDEPSPKGGGQGWVRMLSATGAVQLEQLPRRKPVRLIHAAGEVSYAFTGGERPLRPHLIQVAEDEPALHGQ